MRIPVIKPYLQVNVQMHNRCTNVRPDTDLILLELVLFGNVTNHKRNLCKSTHTTHHVHMQAHTHEAHALQRHAAADTLCFLHMAWTKSVREKDWRSHKRGMQATHASGKPGLFVHIRTRAYGEYIEYYDSGTTTTVKQVL